MLVKNAFAFYVRSITRERHDVQMHLSGTGPRKPVAQETRY